VSIVALQIAWPWMNNFGGSLYEAEIYLQDLQKGRRI
jgi:hypothetical protein